MAGVLWILCLLLVWVPVALAQNTGPRSIPAVESAPNDTSTGTTQYLLAKINSAGNLVTALTTDTAIPLYPCVAGCGNVAGTVANYMKIGEALCTFDNTTSSKGGTWVTASTTTAGRCHQQDSPPTNGYVIGTLLDASTTVGQQSRISVQNQSYVPGSPGSGSGTVNSGTIHSLAYYPATGTTVDDLPAIPTLNRGLIGDGTDWITSAVGMAGAGACTNQFVRANNANAVPSCATVGSADVNNTIALTGSGINTSSQPISAPATWAFQGTTTPTTLVGQIDNYNGCTNVACRVDGGAADRNWTGIAAPALDGEVKEIINIGTTNALILKDQSTSSTAVNRFALTNDVTLPPGINFFVRYDATSQRWRPMVSAVFDPYAVRVCELDIGSVNTNSPPLEDAEDTPTACGNRYGKAWKMTSMLCKADAAGLTILPILTGGTTSSILTGGTACTCGTSWTACSLNGTPTLNSFDSGGVSATCTTTPCTLDANIAVAGGTARRVQMVFTGSLQK